MPMNKNVPAGQDLLRGESEWLPDRGGRRRIPERRRFRYTCCIPERRSGEERRQAGDRRQAPRSKPPEDALD